MLYRTCFLVSLVLVTNPATAAEEPWVLHGRIVDQQGKPVADVDVSRFWCANGVKVEQARILISDGDDDRLLDKNEGAMEPWTSNPTKSDAAGRFSMIMKSRHYFVLAIDKERKFGALVKVDTSNVPALVDVKLVPLVRLHGRVRIAATGQPAEGTRVIVRLPPSDEHPISKNSLAMCSSLQSRFEFWLPPGDYELVALGEMSGGYELHPYPSVTLSADQRDVDAGTLELTPEPPRPAIFDRIDDAKSKKSWVDYTKRYGKPAPKWHVADARGISKDAQPADLKGKWVLVYFWGPSCPSCLGRTLPALTEFYEAHEEQRDLFEIVSICISPDGELKSMADLDRKMAPIVENVWLGKTLPFPVMLDDTGETFMRFGLEFFGPSLLIDPAGHLVPGDEKTLAEKLEGTKRTSLRN